MSACLLIVRGPDSPHHYLRQEFKSVRGAKGAEAKLRWLFDQQRSYTSVIYSEARDELSRRAKGQEWRDAPKKGKGKKA